ncbi:MAG: hypothetical protein QGI18_05730 [Candidatus Marinimicrobia bacterium]|jgi:hypothetical protein|nr:hypothetical protein [Candidatus Neomarinimicrobiota bacterium]
MGYTVKPNATLLSTGGVWSSAGTVQGIIDSFENPANKFDLQRNAIQNELIKKQNDEVQNTYNKINTLPGTSHLTLDQNIKNFFMDEIDYGFDIKMLAKNGKMGQREANKILAKLGNDMNTYTALAPQILAQAKIMQEAMATGTISRANANEMQLMFMGIANNAGDIKIDRDENGNMFLAGSGTIAGEEWSGRVNIQEIQQYLGGEGAQIARTIPTSEEMGLKAIYADLVEKGMIDDYGKPTYDAEWVGDRRMRTDKLIFGTEEIANLSDALMKNPGLFENFMTSEAAVAAWVDIANADLSVDQLNTVVDIPKTIPDPNCPEGDICEEIPNPDYNPDTAGKEKWGDWDVNNKEKKNYLKRKLIDRMLAENLDKEVIGKMVLDKQYYDAQNARLAGTKLSAGAKKASNYYKIIKKAINSADLSALSNLSKNINVVQQDDGGWTVTGFKVVTDDDTGQIKREPVDLKIASTSLDKPGDLAMQMFNIFGVSPYIDELGLDLDKLIGWEETQLASETETLTGLINTEVDLNENISYKDLLNKKEATVVEGKRIPDKGGKTVKQLFKDAGIDIIYDKDAEGDTFKIEGIGMDDLIEKWNGKEVTTENIITISNWLNNNAIIKEKRANEEKQKRTPGLYPER